MAAFYKFWHIPSKKLDRVIDRIDEIYDEMVAEREAMKEIVHGIDKRVTVLEDRGDCVRPFAAAHHPVDGRGFDVVGALSVAAVNLGDPGAAMIDADDTPRDAKRRVRAIEGDGSDRDRPGSAPLDAIVDVEEFT